MKSIRFKTRLAYLLVATLACSPISYSISSNIYANEYVAVQNRTILTVAQAIDKAAGNDYIEGYIVGWGKSGKFVLDNTGATDDVLIIADSVNETDTSKMMAIKLSALGASEQSKWGLGSNPSLLGTKIIVSGNNEGYYGGRGIKTLSSIELADPKSSYIITASHASGKVAIGTTVSLQTTVPDAAILYKTNHDDHYSEYDYNTGIVISQDTIVTAKFEDSSLSEKEFSFEYEAVDLNDLSIEDIRNGNLGSVTFKGIVTRVVENSSKNSIYVQDHTAGMYVYEVVGGDQVNVGDEVIVTGNLESYSELLEVTNATVTLSTTPTLSAITPEKITIAEFMANPGAYESKSILIKDATLSNINYSGNTTITDATGETVIHKIVSGIEEGYDCYDIIALGARHNNSFQLSVVNGADVIPTEGIQKVADSIIKQGESLNLVSEVEVIQAGVRSKAPVIWNQEDRDAVNTDVLGSYSLRYSVLGENFTTKVTVVSAEGVKISDIQGKSHISPLLGANVAGVEGVITAIDGKYGFYMQDIHPDHDDATSDAIYVELYNHGLEVGTLVEVSGTVAEEIGYTTNTNSDEDVQLLVTQITATTADIIQTGVELPAPVIIGENGRMPSVSDIIDNDNFTNFDPEEDFIDFYESLEGMLVEIQDAQVVGGNKYNEIPVVPDRGIHSSNGLSSQGGVVISENTMHPEILMLAKGMYTKQPTVMVGDVFAGSVVGVLTYNDGNYKVAVSETLPQIEEHTYDTDRTTTLEETEDGLRIASFNVENLGGDGKQSKIDNIAQVIVDQLLCPDIIGLQEVQDNSGSTNDGTVAADLVYTRMIAAIEALNPNVSYDYVEIAPENNKDGGAPGGNIRVGMIYRTDRVTLADAPAGDTSTAVEVVAKADGGASLSLNPGRIDPQNSVFSSTRKSLAVEFIFKGESVFVINNHLSSKGGDTPLFGNIQPAYLGSEAKRTEQAQVVNNFVKELLAVDSDAKIVLLGDMNDYYFSNPVKTLAGNELYNMHYSLPETERYTYSYQGKSQVLDNILVTKGLEKYTDIDILHMNSSRAKGVQLSDHDPIMIRLNMGDIVEEDNTHPDNGSDNNPDNGSSGESNGGSNNTEQVKPIKFVDIENHWAQKDIEYLASKGLIVGVGNNEFAPNRGIKACDFKALLSRIYDGEIVLGNLKDGQLLTRAQLAVIIKESMEPTLKVNTSKLLAQFKDINGLSNSEIEALAYMYELGLLRGVSGTQMSPTSTVTRAQAATIIVRLLQKK